MKKLHSVVWSEGLFLTPQHFQARDRSVENNLQFRSVASHFGNWGLTELDIDEASLATGLFTLNRCSGIFEDGLAFSIPKSDDPPESRKLPAQQTVDVFLAIRERKGKDVFLGEPASPADTPRYIAKADPIADENQNPNVPSEDGHAIQFASRNFRLLFGTDSLHGFSVLPIARVAARSAGGFQLVPELVPPCLDFTSSPHLLALLNSRVAALEARARAIASHRQLGIGTVGFQNPEDLWLLHAINSYLPALKHVRDVRHGHPEVPYMLMVELAGELCTFSPNADAGQLPKYDHSNLGDCFTRLDHRIEELLQVFSKSKCAEIPLKKEGLFWTGILPEGVDLKNSHLFLGVRAAMGIPDLIREVPQRIKIASQEKIEILYRSAVPGVALRHETSPPVECPVRSGTQYFRLNQGGPVWNEIKQDIGIYVHHYIEQPELQLLIALG